MSTVTTLKVVAYNRNISLILEARSPTSVWAVTLPLAALEEEPSCLFQLLDTEYSLVVAASLGCLHSSILECLPGVSPLLMRTISPGAQAKYRMMTVVTPSPEMVGLGHPGGGELWTADMIFWAAPVSWPPLMSY